MPYIQPYNRPPFDDVISQLPPIMVAGNLNYIITKITQRFIEERGENYEAYNSAIGALESAKLEYYRRKVAPYEDTKIEANGDY
ncbi:MAG: hypothetical protein EBU90_30245 [Proteobacteria bacterium]|nr:hypothetical protein [Pseudomonadota bacterium]